MKAKRSLLFVLIPAILILSGCTINLGLGGKSNGPDGGVYKTSNRGESWQQKALIPTTSGNPSVINNLDATFVAIDPSDSKAIYYGTVENGMYYSYDGGESWLPIKSLGPVTPTAFAVDPAAKCTLYVAITNKAMKSTDCGRTWQQVYYDNELDVTVSSIAIDHYDSRNVYISTSRGEIILSSDFGKSWRTLNRFDNEVMKVVIAPADSRIIFVATKSKGLFRSMDKGTSWESLAEQLKEFPNSARFRDMAFSKAEPGLVLLANDYGILKTINFGDDWTALNLITPEKEAVINSLSVSQKNSKEIYYITNTTFYGTTDGGQNWSTKKLPSSRAGWTLVDDPTNPGIMYLGVKNLE